MYNKNQIACNSVRLLLVKARLNVGSQYLSMKISVSLQRMDK